LALNWRYGLKNLVLHKDGLLTSTCRTSLCSKGYSGSTVRGCQLEGDLFCMEKIFEELNKKIWYRFVKTIYILSFVVINIFFFINSYQNNKYRPSLFYDRYIGGWSEIFLSYIIKLVLIVLIFEIIKRSFYYIVFGKLFPKNNKFNGPIN